MSAGYEALTMAIQQAEALLQANYAALSVAQQALETAASSAGLAGPNVTQSGAGGSFSADRVGYLAELRQRTNSLTLDGERLVQQIEHLKEIRNASYPFAIVERRCTPGAGAYRL